VAEKPNVPREARSSHDGGRYDVRLTGAERWAADGSMQQVCDRGSARADVHGGWRVGDAVEARAPNSGARAGYELGRVRALQVSRPSSCAQLSPS
jgi:hypothetical protein